MKYRLIAFDVDGTLTHVRSLWQFIHENLGLWNEQACEYEKMYSKGEISYKKFCELDTNLWKGVQLETLNKIIDKVPFHDGIDELFLSLQKQNFEIVLISTGLSILVDRIKNKYKIKYAVSNHLLDDGEKLTGSVKINVDWNQKAEHLKQIARELNIPLDECVSVGDSSGDLDMFKITGFSIAFNPISDKIIQCTSINIKNSSLIKIMDYVS
jgi:phosphoserine phosphatase